MVRHESVLGGHTESNATIRGPGEDNAGVVARPPLIYLAAFVIGLGLDWAWPLPVLPGLVQGPLGAALIAAGVLAVVVARRRFRAAGTNVETFKPTTTLVTGGLYRFSRNPIYLALTAITAGLGVAVDTLWVPLLLVPALAIVRIGVVAREERYLERTFGEDYVRYKTSVRRWL